MIPRCTTHTKAIGVLFLAVPALLLCEGCLCGSRQAALQTRQEAAETVIRAWEARYKLVRTDRKEALSKDDFSRMEMFFDRVRCVRKNSRFSEDGYFEEVREAKCMKDVSVYELNMACTFDGRREVWSRFNWKTFGLFMTYSYEPEGWRKAVDAVCFGKDQLVWMRILFEPATLFGNEKRYTRIVSYAKGDAPRVYCYEPKRSPVVLVMIPISPPFMSDLESDVMESSNDHVSGAGLGRDAPGR